MGIDNSTAGKTKAAEEREGEEDLQVLRRAACTAGTAELGLEKLVAPPRLGEAAGRAEAAEEHGGAEAPGLDLMKPNEAGVMSGQTGGMSGKNDSNGGGE